MKIACLMPTYNRIPECLYFLEEAIASFFRQTHTNRLLIIHNDCPQQKIVFDHPQVMILATERFPTLSAKIQFMIDEAKKKECEGFCRWDDDDISLPWRLELSLEKLLADPKRVEWRASNHWYVERNEIKGETDNPGNSHVHSLFTTKCLELIGDYPKNYSGGEDQAFNRELERCKQPKGERLPLDQIYYLYRWATGGQHLSGPGGDAANLRRHWDSLGKRPVQAGTFVINPRWHRDYVEDARIAAKK